MKNLIFLATAFCLIAQKTNACKMFDPNEDYGPSQVCAKLKHMDSSIDLTSKLWRPKWLYKNTFEDVDTKQRWEVITESRYVQNNIEGEYIKLEFPYGYFNGVGRFDMADTAKVVSEAECALANEVYIEYKTKKAALEKDK